MADFGFQTSQASASTGLNYQGTWNASTNSPFLASGVGTSGYYYIVTVAGNTDLDGITDWQVGDWAIFNGTAWQKIDNSGISYQGTWDALTNNPFLQSSVGFDGHFYIVSVAGSTNLNGITTWNVGDWAIFTGGVWLKINNTSGIGGSGTTNYVSKFTAASTIGDSQIFDNSTNVGIGTISPTEKLEVSGNVKLTTKGSIYKIGAYDALSITQNASSPNIIIGHGNTMNDASNGGGIVIGASATSSSDGIAIGLSAVINVGTEDGIAIGRGTTISGGVTRCLAIGRDAISSADNAWAIGNYVTANNPDTIIFGANTAGNKQKVGIGTSNPTATLHVKGIDSTSSNFALKVDNSASASLLSVRNDGLFIFNGTTDGATSGNNNFEYKTITGSTRSAYYGATGLETFFDFYTNSVKNTSINEFSGYYAIIPKNRFSIKTFNDSKTHFWMDGIANGFIGIGDNYFVPTAQTHIKGIDATSSNYALKVENSTPTNLLSVRNDGVVDIYGTITPRLQSIVSSATVTPTNLNDEVVITAQATGLTLVNPTGTAVQGQSMIIRIKDNGTARTIAYDTQYRAIGVTLPTTTVINKIVYLGLIYNSTDTKWDVIGVSQEA